MQLVNIDYIPGKEFEALGIAKGTVVYSRNFGKDFMAGMKTLVGGEIEGYTEMLNTARQIAEGIVKSVMDSHLGVFHWANKQNITFNMLRGLIEKEGKVEKREVDDGKVIKNVQRALARFVDRERWERYWWHDLFQSSHHFFDAQNANRIQRQQTLKIKELIKAIKEV